MSTDVKVHEEAFDIVRETSGEVLSGVLTWSSQQPKLGPITVWVHGTLSEATHNFTNELAQRLAKEFGVRSYRYNSRFHATEKEPHHRYRFSGFEDDIDDMRNVVRTLTREGFEVWGLVGHSRGANDALIYASRYHTSGIQGSSSLGTSRSMDSIVQLAAQLDSEGDSNLLIDAGKLAVVRCFCLQYHLTN